MAERIVIDYVSGHRRPRRVRSLPEELFKLAVLATLFVTYGLEGDREKPVGMFFLAGMLLWVGVAAAYVVAVLIRKPLLKTGRRWVLATIPVLGVTLAWFPISLRYYYSCPHGERWANNQFGIARSYNGGPCGNGARARGTFRWHVGGPWYIFVPIRY